MLKSSQEWVGLIVCKNVDGALVTPGVGPVGALYVNGVVNAAAVTVSGTNPYKWTVTLPALTAGDLVSMYVTATIDSVATAEVVAEDVADTYRTSDIEALVDDIGVAGAGLTAITAKTDLLTSATSVTIASPVSGSNVTTIQGDDYDTADGRQLSWTVSSTATLTGGVATVIIHGVGSYTGTVVDETTITLDLTAAQTAAIPVGQHKYQVIVTQTPALGSDKITVAEGPWSHKARMAV